MVIPLLKIANSEICRVYLSEWCQDWWRKCLWNLVREMKRKKTRFAVETEEIVKKKLTKGSLFSWTGAVTPTKFKRRFRPTDRSTLLLTSRLSQMNLASMANRSAWWLTKWKNEWRTDWNGDERTDRLFLAELHFSTPKKGHLVALM